METDHESRITNHEPHGHLFPVFLKVKDRLCVIIGGGNVARRKAEDLLPCGAKLQVVSPAVVEPIEQWAEQGLLTWHAKQFTEEDLSGACIVFAATDNSDENRHVVTLCNNKGVLVNVVDDPQQCDFFVPAVLRRKALAVAIATAGKSPLFARKLRTELEEIITDEYGEFLEMLGSQRERIKRTVSDISERRRIFEALIDSDILELLKSGKPEKAKERLEQCLSSLQD